MKGIGMAVDTRLHKLTCARLGKPGPTGFKACDCRDGAK